MRIRPYLHQAGRLGLLPLTCLSLRAADAGSATWNEVPTNGSWSTPANWTPATVPNITADTATFASSTITALTSASLNVGNIVFQPGASAFTITPSNPYEMIMAGPGIVNNSGVLQKFDLPAVPQFGGDEESENLFTFAGSATAGDLIQYTVFGSSGADCKTDNAGLIYFTDTTTAGSATFIVNAGSRAGECRGLGGGVDFFGSSSAEDGTFTLNGGAVFSGYKAIVTLNDNATAVNATFTLYGGTVGLAVGGFLGFSDQSSAGNATITVNAGSVSGAFASETLFNYTSTAANATLIANGGAGEGGRIRFFSNLSDPPSGGTAQIEVFGNGNLDISGCEPGVTTGSLQGDGLVFLGANNLTLGTNGLSTLFSGTIADGGFSGGAGGSLGKIGDGVFTLSAASTYTGGTTVSAGTLLVSNLAGSATGTGPVLVNAGTLGGSGVISGVVTIGTGSGGGAFLAPAFGTNKQVTLTLQSSLTLQADAIYTYTFKARKNQSRTDLVVARGITINNATFAITGTTQGRMKRGTVLTVLSNTSANPISGTFSNLADGAIITVNGNNLQASYQGGNGNDLTLTVVR